MRDIKAFAALVAGGALALTFIFPALAGARDDIVQLQVEGPDSTLDSGTWYVVDGEEKAFKRVNEPNCSPRKGKLAFGGVNALTTLGAGAEANEALAPAQLISFDFGPQVCSIGGIDSYGTFPNATGGWLYWANYTGAISSPDVAQVEDGDSVIYFYARFDASEPAAARGTGPALHNGSPLRVVGVPAQDADGEFTVSVVSHEYDGTPVPFEGAEIEGVTSFTDEGGGQYTVLAEDGFSGIRAFDPAGFNVPSAEVEVCVGPSGDCPEAHGRRTIGTDGPDSVRGTAGWDKVSTGGGKDKINLTQGGEDTANCGGGKDTVVVEKGDKDDTIKQSCEKVEKT